MTKDNDSFSAREISVAINNALIKALRPHRLGTLRATRFRQLRDYTAAILEPLYEHMDEGLLHPEELVAVFVAAAMLVQHARVCRTKMSALAGLDSLAPDEEQENKKS